MQSPHEQVRVVILRESTTGEAYKAHVRDDYEAWLKDHIDMVAHDTEAAPLLSEIHARRGTDTDGHPVFVTTFHFISEDAMKTYASAVGPRMRNHIEQSFPGATKEGGFGYQISTQDAGGVDAFLEGQEIHNLQTIGHVQPTTTITTDRPVRHR